MYSAVAPYTVGDLGVRMMKKKTTIITSIILALLLLAGALIWQWSRNLIAVENASGKNIKELTVTVCRQSYGIKDLAPGASRKLTFEVTGDSGFQVDVSFSDGAEISDNFGYVTGGAGAYHNRAKITIRSDEINGTQEY